MAQYEKKWLKNQHIDKDKIVCEICGKSLQLISENHLRIHKLSQEEYKIRFPLSPTVSQNLSERMSMALKRRIEKGEIITIKKGESRIKGKSIKRKQYNNIRNIYSHRRGVTSIEKYCKNCNKLFIRPLTKTKERAVDYCSRKCYYDYIHKTKPTNEELQKIKKEYMKNYGKLYRFTHKEKIKEQQKAYKEKEKQLISEDKNKENASNMEKSLQKSEKNTRTDYEKEDN